MRVIEPGYELIRPQSLSQQERQAILLQIEDAARTCYKSTAKNKSPEATAKFVASLVAAGHEAMIEHVHMSVRFTVDRGVSHEIVRHRIASYAQESTRYCSYDKEKFGSEITVVRPQAFEPGTEAFDVWKAACQEGERAYFHLLSLGVAPEYARDVLPTSLKTEIVVTMNLREWRHFFKLRAVGTTGKPHPQMRQVAAPLLEAMRAFLPEIFGDIG
ncbi:MAG TPA: FAD-dependent thymidylate synthase [Candidatus Aphodomonas merdavium]|nr:FAD-dependent thymidylate synthase [Candidatus Aphodomonas merdavium]